MSRLICAAALVACLSIPCRGADVGWQRIAIDATFRSEGVAAADINHDGKKDVIAGDVWYAAPNWEMRALRPVGKFVAGQGYSTSFCNYAWDVNGDGWDDVIIVGFPGEPFYWYENPQNKPGNWKEHLIWHSACNESPCFGDLTGDGIPELILGSQPESQVGYLPIPAKKDAVGKWNFHAVGQPGNSAQNGSNKFYHGLGIGDMNGDGRTDVVIPNGWWEAPKDRGQSPWDFHPFVLSQSGTGNPLPGSHIHVEDLDLDGDSDILMCCAHAYGVWWFENVKEGDTTKFRYHAIDESYSQTHASEFVDINGDGELDLVTGKRYYAHNGKDPGAEEPVVMYWYEIHRQKGQPPQFIPHEITEGRGTGVGTQFLVTDMNGDSKPDIVLSNKRGVNVLLQGPAGK